MTAKVVGGPPKLMSLAEEAVLRELQQLPEDYTITVNPPRMPMEGASGGISYVPDFIISKANGKRLIVEVKSLVSLSLSNMAKLSTIGSLAHEHGDGFVVLVVDHGAPKDTNSTDEQEDRLHERFQNLKVLFVRSHGQLQKDVGDVFEQLADAK